MRILITLALMFASLELFPVVIRAESDMPAVVTDGLAAYEKSGGKEAMAIWLKGSPVENDAATKGSINGYMANIETSYGKMIGYEIIRVVPISPSCRRVYLVIKHEKGPVFYAFDCYKANGDWIVPTIDFNTRPKEVLPSQILSGSQSMTTTSN